MRLTGKIALLALLLVVPPLLGAWVAGRPLAPYLEFPPRTRDLQHEPFSWPVFVALAVIIVGVIAPFLMRVCKSPRVPEVGRRLIAAFPWWGWLGIGWTSIAWLLAWTRFSWMAPVQDLTFTPLWLGYIVVVNALSVMRTGRCLLVSQPRFFLLLFPLSALFWWFFEYLNRFAENWYYINIDQLTPAEYFWRASLPFSTVLPAVLSTKELLASFPQLSRGLANWLVVEIGDAKSYGWGLLILSGIGLAGIGVWPKLFPLVWVAPLLVITAVQTLFREPTVFSGIARGDWRSIWEAALAALVCGFFWEMWNSQSLARWEYAVPFVHRFQILEMPLLGYAGYLPFGLECLAIAEILRSNRQQ